MSRVVWVPIPRSISRLRVQPLKCLLSRSRLRACSRGTRDRALVEESESSVCRGLLPTTKFGVRYIVQNSAAPDHNRRGDAGGVAGEFRTREEGPESIRSGGRSYRRRLILSEVFPRRICILI